MKKFTIILMLSFFTASMLTGQQKLQDYGKMLRSAVRTFPERTDLTQFLTNRDMTAPVTSDGISRQTLSWLPKQGLDSLYQYIWDENNNEWACAARQLSVYDTAGNCTLSVWDKEDGCGFWVHDRKIEYTFDSIGRMAVFVRSNWDVNNDLWVPEKKYEYAYDTPKNDIEVIFSMWDINMGQWEKKLRYDQKNNENGQIESYITLKWDTNQNTWILYMKEEYSYDDQGNKTLHITYVWDANATQWITVFKTEYLYDTNDNLRFEINYHWDPNAGQWVGDDKIENIYDNNNLLITAIYSLWDSGNGQWAPVSKEEITYNNYGKKVLDVFYLYDDINSQWVNQSKTETFYDINGVVYLEHYYKWDNINGTWVDDSKNNYVYNADYTYDDLLLPPLYRSDYGKMLFAYMLTELKSAKWDVNNNIWVNDTKYEFYYSEHDVYNRIQENYGHQVRVYPNPAVGSVNIELEEENAAAVIHLYDMNGRKVLSRSFRGAVRLGVNSLSKGMYFYQISYGQETLKGKIIVE